MSVAPIARPSADSGRHPWLTANVRQTYALALAGAAGAVFGLFLYTELVSASSVYVRDALAGTAIGGTIGFFLNASGPFREGAWIKLARAATWGAIAGALGGAIGLVFGEFVIGWFRGGVIGRAASWSVLGLGIGLSQGLAERSRTRLFYGLIGGGFGGFVGGFLFELLRQLFANRYDVSQGLGIAILGAGLGASLALVEQALRRAWVQVMSGRQEGRSYLLSRPFSAIGLDERAEVGLFGDAMIARKHAAIERGVSGYILRNHADAGRTRVNGDPVASERVLRDGDRITIGQTSLIFRQR